MNRKIVGNSNTKKVYKFIINIILKIIKYLLDISMQTSTTIIYNKIYVKNFKYIHNLSTLIEFHKYKHLIYISDLEYNTRYIYNRNTCLPKFNNTIVGQKII
jgi:hypothetical protein